MRLKLVAFLLGLYLAGVSSGVAQLAGSPKEPTIGSLQSQVELQGQQIEALTREIIRLSRLIEGQPARQGPSVQTSGSSIVPPIKPVPVRPAEPVSDGKPRHEVMKGETLTSIAKRYGTTVDELVKINGISDDRLIQIGQKLILPDGTKVDPNPAAAPPAPPAAATEPVTTP